MFKIPELSFKHKKANHNPPRLNHWRGVMPGGSAAQTCLSVGDLLLDCRMTIPCFKPSVVPLISSFKNNRGFETGLARRRMKVNPHKLFDQVLQGNVGYRQKLGRQGDKNRIWTKHLLSDQLTAGGRGGEVGGRTVEQYTYIS